MHRHSINGSVKTKGGKRVCIIGAGPCGMSALYNFAKMKVVPDIVCYEKHETWGGLWNYSWRTGTDEYGEPCHAGMYKHLWANSPKEVLEYPDYTFDKHFGKPLPSFAPRAVLRDFLEGRFRSCSTDLTKFIRFQTVVRNVSYREDTDDFIVTVLDLKTNTTSSELFSHVIVAVGIFNVPNKPSFPGLESFPGRIVHSHDVRNAEEFKGQRLLVVGAGFSGEDMALQSMKFGASNVVLSWRTKPLGFKWPKGIEERPVLRQVYGRKVVFDDGTSAEVDSIILCTGYVYHFPFLEDKLRLQCPLSFYQSNLYKGALYLDGGNDKLYYIGVQNQFYTFPMFDVLAVWVCGHIMDTLVGEPKDEAAMRKDIDPWIARLNGLKDPSLYDIVNFQTDHVLDLCKATGYSQEIGKSKFVFDEYVRLRDIDISTYREQCFTSIFTGKTAPKPAIPWSEAFNDSVDAFVGK